MFIATLIAAGRLNQAMLDTACTLIIAAGGTLDAPDWLDPGTAADIGFSGELPVIRVALEALDGIDVIVQPAARRRKALLIADMDSTMIEVECIDELADYAGIKAQIAEITERAMHGELDFAAALRERVALLAGLPESKLAECLQQRVLPRIMPGARQLVQTMQANGARCLLVSGGFTYFVAPVAAAIGFDRSLSNDLGMQAGALDGTLRPPIIDAAAKRASLLAAMAAAGLSSDQTLAVGDGANDIAMLQTAGLGVAYHAKPKTEAAAAARIRYGDLTALLYAQGYRRAEWIA
jgi:phosphoserine phosphatase